MIDWEWLLQLVIVIALTVSLYNHHKIIDKDRWGRGEVQQNAERVTHHTGQPALWWCHGITNILVILNCLTGDEKRLFHLKQQQISIPLPDFTSPVLQGKTYHRLKFTNICGDINA